MAQITAHINASIKALTHTIVLSFFGMNSNIASADLISKFAKKINHRSLDKYIFCSFIYFRNDFQTFAKLFAIYTRFECQSVRNIIAFRFWEFMIDFQCAFVQSIADQSSDERINNSNLGICARIEQDLAFWDLTKFRIKIDQSTPYSIVIALSLFQPCMDCPSFV